jgi:hypothetical protein
VVVALAPTTITWGGTIACSIVIVGARGAATMVVALAPTTITWRGAVACGIVKISACGATAVVVALAPTAITYGNAVAHGIVIIGACRVTTMLVALAPTTIPWGGAVAGGIGIIVGARTCTSCCCMVVAFATPAKSLRVTAADGVVVVIAGAPAAIVLAVRMGVRTAVSIVATVHAIPAPAVARPYVTLTTPTKTL